LNPTSVGLAEVGFAAGYDATQVAAGVVGVPLARKPKVVFAPAASEPFHEALLAVTVLPEVVTFALHDWVICCPAASGQPAVHPLIAALPAVMVTSPW